MITQKKVLVVLLIDAMLWGVWFGGFWSYRPAFASRLVDSYLHISISTAMPLMSSTITYVIAIYNPTLFRRHRLTLFKLSALSARSLFLISSVIIYLNIFTCLELLYVFSIILSIAYGIGCITAITWTDYIADNIYESWKPRYIALDSTLSTIGALAGTAIAGAFFINENHVSAYAKLFLTISLIFIIDLPLIMTLKEVQTAQKQASLGTEYIQEKPSVMLYIAIMLLYIATNISLPLVAPYIIHKLGGNEVWLAMINSANFIASLITPILWGEALRRLHSLTLARVSVVITTLSNMIFPYLRSLELQVMRSFVYGVGSIGMWISFFSHIIRDVGREYRIQYSSTMYLIQSLVSAIAMTIGGVMAKIIHSPEAVFLLSAIAFIAIPLIKPYYTKNDHVV